MFLIIFLLLQFNSNSYGSNCGCNTNREQKQFPKNFLNIVDKSNEHQCFTSAAYSNNATWDMILVPEGEYQVGTNDIVIESDKEGPQRHIKLKSFYLDKFEVSNKDFLEFTTNTGYKTEAETFGDSFVFALFINNSYKDALKDFRVQQAPWWYKVSGADWKHPFGLDSDISGLLDHPVTHVSWRDAQAFCAWRLARLPTEAEWEAACRGKQDGRKYPWGNKLFPNKKIMANIWQGSFPHYNSMKDGFNGTSPVHLFPQTELGFHNLAGNVWEWTQDSWSDHMVNEKVKKGGSFLCHKSYCYRYRCSARSHNTDDSSAGNLGFRCAKSV